ncbi:MAG: SpoIID/LytB domain-containing protein [Planctomycetota bacterium]
MVFVTVPAFGEPSRTMLRYDGPYPGPLLTAVTREPTIRVRIGKRLASLDVSAAGQTSGEVSVTGPTGSGAKVMRYRLPLRVAWRGDAWLIRDGAGQAVRWRLPTLHLTAEGGDGTLRVDTARYPGRLVLSPSRGETAPADTFDVVNHVPLETYLPGVLERELFPKWPLETYKAQAVAARSYALWEMTIARGRAFDLESTTASQVYGGKATNTTAQAAVAETRGVVLAYGGRVVPAFFASSTGGAGQDAVLAFPNRVEDIAPLRGRAHGAWDQASPRYRWGPVVRDTAALSRRIAAWGLRHHHPVEHLGTLARVEVSGRNRVGRPATFMLTDTAGRRYTLGCESFRNAGNFTREGELPLPDGGRLLSSHVEVAVDGGRVTVSGGRGHGHGVGMSQWGAYGMAQAGHGHGAILRFYYPGATLTRLY